MKAATTGSSGSFADGYEGSDFRCQYLADQASLGGIWRSVLSFSDLDAKQKIVIRGSVYNMNGELLATSSADFWDGTLSAYPKYSETGADMTSATSYVWTGSNNDGTKDTSPNNWTGTSANTKHGEFTSPVYLFSRNYAPGTTLLPIFCISQTTPKLDGFQATTSVSGADGGVTISIDYPADTSDYGSVKIRRLAGAIPPSADCSTTGTEVASFTSFSDSTYTDNTGSAGAPFSYRACIYDSAGNLAYANHYATNVQSKGSIWRMFISSATYDTNMKAATTGSSGSFADGYEGSDFRCQYLADQASLGGIWRSVLSFSDLDAKQKIVIRGNVYNMNGELLATSSADFWDGTLSAYPKYSETGADMTSATSYVWTGSNNNGTKSTTSDWTGTAANTRYGEFTSPVYTFSQNNGPGTLLFRIYCLSQTTPKLDGFQATTSVSGPLGAITISIDYPADTSDYGSVKIRRMAGANPPSADCSTTGTEVANFTSFSDTTFTDNTGASGSGFSYRACIYDSAGNLAFGNHYVNNVLSKADPCDPIAPTVGAICGDETVFVGESADGPQNMFTTRCEHGSTWDGTSCVGSPTLLPWNNGNTSGYGQVLSATCTSYTDTTGTCLTGKANSATVSATDSNTTVVGSQQHQAAQVCEDLTMNGYSDWYLPSVAELQMIKNNSAAVGNVSGSSWSSSEASASNAFDSDGSIDKSLARRVRCVRKDRRIDFGGSQNYLTPGFQHVRGSQIYTAANGLGFTAQALENQLTSQPANFSKMTWSFYRDAVAGRNSTSNFKYKLENGTYDVRVYYGHSTTEACLRVTAEGVLTVDGPLRAGNIFSTINLSNVTVSDGILDLSFTNQVTGKYWFVNGIDIAPSGKLRGSVP
jgi:protocatechuate 3,4-dioxygenase beta subunit